MTCGRRPWKFLEKSLEQFLGTSFIAYAVLLALPVSHAATDRNLDRWLDAELIPYVREQLRAHPRFKGETVMFVALSDNLPAPVSNALALSIRDRLLQAALDTTGVTVGWQQGKGHTSSPSLSDSPIDCRRSSVHYLIGIELTRGLHNDYIAKIRALDLEDRTWVTGFGLNWQGQLTTIQRRAFGQPRTDDNFTGAREVPFGLEQVDMLAAKLAHELSCALLRQTDGRYIVATRPDSDGLPDATVELIGKHLVNHDALQLADKKSAANATLSGEAHRIDGTLHQYWVSVTPIDSTADLPTLTASAYVLGPGVNTMETATSRIIHTPRVDPPQFDNPSMTIAGSDTILGPLSLSTTRRSDVCRPDRSQRCSILATHPQDDAVVFFLEYQARHGLARLSGRECRNRTTAHIAQAGETLRFPLGHTFPAGTPSWETREWRLMPGIDTFYAIAVNDTNVARRLANLLDHLPKRCSETIRPGLKGPELKQWMHDFAKLADRSAEHLHWRAIEVRDVL